MIQERIFSITSEKDFRELTLEIFNLQYVQNPVYRRFCDFLKVDPNQVKELIQIPFIPIEFFKSHKVIPTAVPVQKIFSSSGTTGSSTSKHMVSDLSIYEKSYLKGFDLFYGDIKDYAVLALLPSYLEREGSSLVYMTDDLIKKSENPHSGFYLKNLEDLKNTLIELEEKEQKILLVGVSFALLELAEKYDLSLKNTIVMETGGMKGRRKEMIREELHKILKKRFGVPAIHSEYGMTELLSQAYSKGHGLFSCPPWMKIIIRDPEDALEYLPTGKTGGINVIDLANLNSCSFIATQDLGKIHKNHQIEILGRFDNSDIRGCNLMVI